MENALEQHRKKCESAQKKIFPYLIKAWSEIKIDFDDEKIKCERDLILGLHFHLRKLFEENKETYELHSEPHLQCIDSFSRSTNRYIDIVIESYEGFIEESLVILYLVECKYFTLKHPFNSVRWTNDFLKWQKIARIQDNVCPRFAHFIVYDYNIEPTNLSPLSRIFSSNPLFIDAFKTSSNSLEMGDHMSLSAMRYQILTERIRTHYAEFVGIGNSSWKIYHNFSFIQGAIENNICPIAKDEIII